MRSVTRRVHLTLRLLGALLISAALLAPWAAPASVRADESPVSCTGWESLITPPKTIRVLRTRTGLVEVVPFKTYVYRTHVAEFWSEYLRQPYSDALLGAGAVAIKQNAWSWTMTARNWWAVSSFTSTQAGWVREDYADDNQLNGSAGNQSWSRQRRASEHADIALRMRIRLGADLEDDGIGGLEWDSDTSTYTAPLEILDESGRAEPVTRKSKRSCFDVVDHPDMNQFYSRGGIYEPGASTGGKSNARYNAAVDATWGMTMQRYYPVSGEWRFWRPGFYGSFTVNRECMLPPDAGDSNVQMRHPTQPSHWRGWSFFPVNADDCARTRNLSVEALLRASFFSFDSDQVAGVGTSSVEDDRFDIKAVFPIRVLSPRGDLTGDAKGDILAVSPAGAVRLISTDSNVDSAGRLNGKAPGSVSVKKSQTLLSRIVARATAEGQAAVMDLREESDGSITLVETPYVGGALKDQTTRFEAHAGFDAGARLNLLATDTANDGIEEVFITELIPESEGGAPHLRLYLVPLSGSPEMIGEIEAATDARMFLDDFTGDGTVDALALWRAEDGSLAASLAQGSGTPPVSEWGLGEFSEPGALLWPISTAWSAAVGDVTGDGVAELYVRYRDPSGVIRLQSFNLDGAHELPNPDKVYVPETEPARSTTVRAGERTLKLVAKRLGVKLRSLIALNSGATYTITIQPNDTYAKIAKRVKKSEACLRSMNGNKVLVRNKTLIVPRDLCVYTRTSVMFRGAPVRILNGEFDWLRAGDTWATVATRAATIGIKTTAESLATLNPSVALTAAASGELIGKKVSIRAPWAPLARSLPATPDTVSVITMRWNSPFEAWRSSSSSTATPELYVRDWNGDGIDEL
ncbi:MAG: FG-GAP repeat domain-containing protein, partial [Candidatus Limnocylindrus sp.]